MEKEFVCIVCPMGCRLHVLERDGRVRVTGNTCARGEKYGQDEFSRPMRMVTSSIFVCGGHLPLLSVKTDGPVPKDRIKDVLDQLRNVSVAAPISIGQCVLRDAAGTGVDIIATRNVRQA